MPNKAKHRPYNPDPNVGLTLTLGKNYLKKVANEIGKRTKKGTVASRRAVKKTERVNRKRG